jgi:hypothetical protein
MSYTGLLINTSTLKHRIFDQWGQPTITLTEIGVRCRIMYANKLIRNAAGEQVVSAAKIFYLPGQTIDHADLIEIGGVDHAILDIRVPQDSATIHHKEVYIA